MRTRGGASEESRDDGGERRPPRLGRVGAADHARGPRAAHHSRVPVDRPRGRRPLGRSRRPRSARRGSEQSRTGSCSTDARTCAGASARRTPTAPRILVLCHHDTVWPIGSLATHPFVVADGVLRGPGCFDMLTGVVMALHGIAALGDLGDAAITLLVTGDEELGSPSSRALIEEEARGCLATFVLEASADGGALKIGRKGVSLYEVELVGRAAHAGLEPEKGLNATVEMAHQIVAVTALADPARGTTVTPTVAHGGTTTNTTAAHASFSIDARALDRRGAGAGRDGDPVADLRHRQRDQDPRRDQPPAPRGRAGRGPLAACARRRRSAGSHAPGSGDRRRRLGWQLHGGDGHSHARRARRRRRRCACRHRARRSSRRSPGARHCSSDSS